MANVKTFKKGIKLDPQSADPTATEGQVQFSDGTVRAKGLWQYKDGAWASIGGSTGSLDIFYSDDFETDGTSNYTSGNNATFDNGGTLDGTLADETTSQIAGDTSLKYTMGSASTNDWIASPSISLDQKQQDEDCAITFYYNYNGADDDIQLIVWDDTNNAELTSTLDTLELTSSDTRFSTTYKVPSTCSALKWGFHVVTGNSGKILRIDDVELSTNPYVYKNFIKKIHSSLEGNDGRAITVNTESIPFSGSADHWTAGADGSTLTNGNYYTVQNDNAVIHVHVGVAFTAQNTGSIGMAVNGSGYRVLTQYPPNDYYKNGSYTFSSGEVSKGDKIAFYMASATGTLINDTTRHYLTIVEEVETEHLVTPAKSGVEHAFYYARGDADGRASTNTAIMYYATEAYNTVSKYGTITNSATLGWFFKATKRCKVTINSHCATTSAAWFGISKNPSSKTTAITGIGAGQAVAAAYNDTATGADSVTWTGILEKDDEIYSHIDTVSTCVGTNAHEMGLSITVEPAEVTLQAAIPTRENIVTKTSTYTATAEDDLILADTTSAWTLTLYSAVGNAGKKIKVKKTTSDTNAVTIDGNGSETIDGATTLELDGQYEAITMISDGSNWHVIERHVPDVFASATNSSVTATGQTLLPLTVGDDPDSLVDTGSDLINVPRDGIYTIGIKGNVGFGTSNWAVLSYQINTGAVETINILTPTSTSGAHASCQIDLRLNAGDTVKFYTQSGSSNAITSIVVTLTSTGKK